MKALSFSKLAFVCALVLGVIVFWAAAAPNAEGAGLIIGGDWVPISEGTCCTSVIPDECPKGFYPIWHPLRGTKMDCKGEGVNVCVVPDYYSPKGCYGYGETVCWSERIPIELLCYIRNASCYIP